MFHVEQFKRFWPSTFPTLVTQRLVLKQLNTDFINEFYDLRSNKALMHQLDKKPDPSISAVEKLLAEWITNYQKQKFIDWAILLKSNSTFIGTIGLHYISTKDGDAEVGYVLSFQHQQKGYMSEALKKVLDFAFKTLQLKSVYANINPANVASQVLLLKHNFYQQDIIKDSFAFDGQMLDTAVYRLNQTKL